MTGQQRSLGVEEELLLLDPRDGRPVAGFDEVRNEAGRQDSTPVEHELMQEQAEIASAPFRDVTSVIADLRRRRDALQRAAHARELGVAACASSPVAAEGTLTTDARYQRMERRFGPVEQQQLTCGMHVHVSVDSPAEGVAVLDRIRIWLPLLVAMTANSPFWQGEDTGYASYRTITWSQWPSAGATEVFDSVDNYRQLIADLLSSGSILDEGMVYFDARLSRQYPTVEIRVSDVCTDLDLTALAAALSRALVVTAAADAANGLAPPDVRTELLRVATWSSARYGTSGELFDVVDRRSRPAADVLDRLVDHVRAALISSGDRVQVEDALRSLLSKGGGAEQQRNTLAATQSLADVARDVMTRT